MWCRITDLLEGKAGGISKEQGTQLGTKKWKKGWPSLIVNRQGKKGSVGRKKIQNEKMKPRKQGNHLNEPKKENGGGSKSQGR